MTVGILMTVFLASCVLFWGHGFEPFERTMKIGICSNMQASLPDGTGMERLEQYTRSRFDYVELPLAQVMALSREDYAVKREQLQKSHISCYACNNFFPSSIRLTGEGVDSGSMNDYAWNALSCAAELGAGIVVFGSSGARNIPPGFPADAAFDQLVEELRVWAGMAGKLRLTIAIEPLNRMESNIINTLAEAESLRKIVNCENVKCLLDIYHFLVGNEHEDSILAAGGNICHVHCAAALRRALLVRSDDPGVIRVLRALHQCGYDLGVSLEGREDGLPGALERSRIMFEHLWSCYAA
jgi:D-psicose/D-tagatose/L-ribulose 3-epimerase